MFRVRIKQTEIPRAKKQSCIRNNTVYELTKNLISEFASTLEPRRLRHLSQRECHPQTSCLI